MSSHVLASSAKLLCSRQHFKSALPCSVLAVRQRCVAKVVWIVLVRSLPAAGHGAAAQPQVFVIVILAQVIIPIYF